MSCGSIRKSTSVSSSSSITNRSIIHKTVGNSHGPITRLVSPSDLGQITKPFVFLDAFKMPAGPRTFKGFGYHPHSGIATVTLMLEGSMWYEETHSKGEVEAGGVEFFRAASGAWHTGGAIGEGAVRGYQLWLSLPASQELETPDSFYLKAKDVPREGPARIILGRYGTVQSPIPSVTGINYLDVRMMKGEKWIYNVPSNHTVAFISVWKGKIKVFDDIVKADELVVLEESGGGNLNFASDDDEACFILGTAEKHPHDLVLGSYSVHTCKESLIKGEANIKKVGAEMKAKGIL